MSYPLIELSELILKRNGSVNPTKFLDETFELHSIPAFDKGHPEILKGSDIGSSKQIVQENDVMISKIVPHIRRASVVPKAGIFRQIASSEWIVFRSERFVPNYLKHVLVSDSFNTEFMATVSGVGGSLLRARPAFVEKIKIPFPPLEEQCRIAAILDQADALRQKRQQSLEKLDQLLQAAFIEMFGDPVSNPKGWDTMCIESLIAKEKYSLKRGPFGGALKKEIFVDSGYLVYEQYHALNSDFSFQRYFINEDKYQELKAFTVKPKDIIISCSGVNLGKLAEIPLGSPVGIINQALLKVTLNEEIILNDFFIEVFSHPNFKKAFYGDFRGAAIPNFPPMSVFKEFQFIIPPLKQQQKYVDLKKMLNTIKKSASMSNLDNLFNSLQQKAFTGRL